MQDVIEGEIDRAAQNGENRIACFDFLGIVNFIGSAAAVAEIAGLLVEGFIAAFAQYGPGEGKHTQQDASSRQHVNHEPEIIFPVCQ